MQCDGQSCYYQSVQSNSICEPAYVDPPVSMVDLKFDFYFQLGCVSVLWFLLVSLNLVELFLQKEHQHQSPTDPAVNQSTGRNKYISWLIALLGFTLPLGYMYQKSFQPDLFCLMNRQEPICKRNWEELSRNIDCFELAAKPNSSIKIYLTSLSGFVETGWF